ncbi:MAG: mandelate racemase [Pseudomonadota bacterium]|nr:mandelate racemase [Pseudomonadota bacterium]
MQPQRVRGQEAKPPSQDRIGIKDLRVNAYRIPTSSPESDGTLQWESTTLVTVHASAGGATGFGYTYASPASATLIHDMLRSVVLGLNAVDITFCHERMCEAVRNLGRGGIAACAIAAVDNALWDLKARLLDRPIIHLLGAARKAVPVYGSGGFTSSGPAEVEKQIEGWREQGIWQFKIKIGRDAAQDRERISAAVRALPPSGRLFVDANGAYHARQALEMAQIMEASGVAWFEEPVPSDDEEGLRFVREHAPACMDIAAGEYAYELKDFYRLLDGRTIDVLQADATRCLGVTGFLKAAAMSEAYRRPLSSHCAPSLHVPLMCHIPAGVHIEYFWDHVRIENMLFEGCPQIQDGLLMPQTQAPGFGLTLKGRDAEKFAL